MKKLAEIFFPHGRIRILRKNCQGILAERGDILPIHGTSLPHSMYSNYISVTIIINGRSFKSAWTLMKNKENQDWEYI